MLFLIYHFWQIKKLCIIFFIGWMNNQTMIHPYNEIQLRNKKEQTIDSRDMDECQMHFAKWKKPDPKST